MSFGVDFAQEATPSLITALRQHSVSFVCRYLSHTDGKNLHHDEAVRLSNAGLWIVPVWETTAKRLLSGRAGGLADARDAAAQAKACGMPGDRPIYFAADWDVQHAEMPAVMAYLDAANEVLGNHRAGIYGGYLAVKSAMDQGIRWAWQTYAWSGGKWDSRAQLQQWSNDHVIGGVGLDYDRAMRSDFGQWKVGVSPDVHPTPDPTPKEEDDMPFGTLNREPAANGKRETPISCPPGVYTKIGFLADGGLLGLPPAKVRVAQHLTTLHWKIDHVEVDSTKAKPVVNVDPACDGLSVSYEDDGALPVGWDMS